MGRGCWQRESCACHRRWSAFSTFTKKAVLVNGASAFVAAVAPLPPGDYLVTAKATVRNFDNDAVWDCFLLRDDGVEIESSGSSTSTDSAFATIVNVGLTSLPFEQTIKMGCGNIGRVPDSELSDISMTAVQVGRATIACPDLSGGRC
jgi:hypothetical protein